MRDFEKFDKLSYSSKDDISEIHYHYWWDCVGGRVDQKENPF